MTNILVTEFSDFSKHFRDYSLILIKPLHEHPKIYVNFQLSDKILDEDRDKSTGNTIIISLRCSVQVQHLQHECERQIKKGDSQVHIRPAKNCF